MLNKSFILKGHALGKLNSIIDIFYNDLVSEEDQKLLDLAFAQKVEQQQLDDFLKIWDIEKFGEKKSIMLSYLMKANPDLKFSNYEKPRLEGLLRFHRFHNLKLISHYSKIAKSFNQKNIFPLIFKGGAMKHLRPDLSRVMGDIDILIRNENELEKAREICQNLGYVEEIPDDHSIDLHLPNSKEGTVDLHRYVDFEHDYDKSFIEDLFLRAKKEEVFGAQSFLPCHEDLFFLAMMNLSRNLNNQTSLHGILYALFDFKYLLESKPNFNWDLVLKNIAKTKTHAQALLAMQFTNKIIPKMLPNHLIENATINKKYQDYCDHIIFHHFYFNELRASGKKLSIKNALKNSKELKNYLTKKPKYFIIKRVVRKSALLIKIFLFFNNKLTKK